MKKLKISVEIVDDDGKKIVKTVSKREIPYFKEFERDGFTAAFGELESAVLEARKEATEEAISQYITGLSKKNETNRKS